MKDGDDQPLELKARSKWMKEPTARVELDPRTTIQRRWITYTTGPSGITHKARSFTRNTAIENAASFLTYNDERRIAAQAVYDKARSAVHREHRDAIAAATVEDPE